MTDLYTTTVPPFIKALDNLSKILDKAAAHAAGKATERRPAAYFERALLNDCLIFDQFPLLMQVQRVSDNAKGGPARLAGIEGPKMEDAETTIAELKDRLAKTAAFLKTLTPEQFVGSEERKIELPYWKGKYLTGFEYATVYLVPNFYFHYATAYSILRKNGVDVGKDDYIGNVPLKEL